MLFVHKFDYGCFAKINRIIKTKNLDSCQKYKLRYNNISIFLHNECRLLFNFTQGENDMEIVVREQVIREIEALKFQKIPLENELNNLEKSYKRLADAAFILGILSYIFIGPFLAIKLSKVKRVSNKLAPINERIEYLRNSIIEN